MTMATKTTLPTVTLYQPRVATGGPDSPRTREVWGLCDEAWTRIADLDASDPPDDIEMVTMVETPAIMWGTDDERHEAICDALDEHWGLVEEDEDEGWWCEDCGEVTGPDPEPDDEGYLCCIECGAPSLIKATAGGV